MMNVPFFVPAKRKYPISLKDNMKYSQKGAQYSFGVLGYSFDGFNSKLSS